MSKIPTPPLVATILPSPAQSKSQPGLSSYCSDVKQVLNNHEMNPHLYVEILNLLLQDYNLIFRLLSLKPQKIASLEGIRKNLSEC